MTPVGPSVSIKTDPADGPFPSLHKPEAVKPDLSMPSTSTDGPPLTVKTESEPQVKTEPKPEPAQVKTEPGDIEEASGGWEPPNWRDQLAAIQQMRSARDAPGDKVYFVLSSSSWRSQKT